MMLYDKYERGRQHLSTGQQKITYKKKIKWNKNKNNTYPAAYPK